jgi:hypothetical protein
MLANAVLSRRSALAALLIVAGIAPCLAASTIDDIGLAEPTAAALAGWQRYERQVDDRYRQAVSDPFFAEDAYKEPGWRQAALGGQVSMFRLESATPGGGDPGIPDARVHHWVGAVYVRGVTLERVLQQLRDGAGRESESFEDVVASKLLSRDGDHIRVYMKLRRDSVITVTYNTEHDVAYRTLGATRATSRSAATKIAELMDAGTANERERPPANDHGFLWRLNAYWRYEQVNDGVLIECESVSLSRTVPVLLRPFITGTVEGIARDALQKTLVGLRNSLTRSAATRPK